jgi:hypothetical protein
MYIGKGKVMSSKVEKNKLLELKQMVKDKPKEEPTEEVLAVFCQRHGLSLETCRYYYNRLVESGEIKEK